MLAAAIERLAALRHRAGNIAARPQHLSERGPRVEMIGLGVEHRPQVALGVHQLAGAVGGHREAPVALDGGRQRHQQPPQRGVGLQNTYGYLLVRAGTDLATAERALRLARARAPGDPAVLDSWGWLRLRQGKVRLALRALRRAVDLAPHDPELRAHLAEALAIAGALEASGRTWRRAAALVPPGATRRRIEARAAAR